MDDDAIYRWGPVTRQEYLAGASLTPGDLVMVSPTGGTAGQVVHHGPAGTRAAPLFANLNLPYGGGKDDVYAVGDAVQVLAPAPGALIMARCAVELTIGRGQPLQSAGNGLLQLATTGPVVAEADEDESTVGETAPGRLRVRIVAQ